MYKSHHITQYTVHTCFKSWISFLRSGLEACPNSSCTEGSAVQCHSMEAQKQHNIHIYPQIWRNNKVWVFTCHRAKEKNVLQLHWDVCILELGTT